MIKTLYILISLIFSLQISAQLRRNEKSEKIDKYIYKNVKNVPLDSSLIKVDSASINIIYTQNSILTKHLFDKNGGSLKIDYFFKDKKLIKVSIAEKSPRYSDLNRYTIFYYDTDQNVFYTSYLHNIRVCMAIPFDKTVYELYGYNPNFNEDFLKDYVMNILKKVKKDVYIK